RDWGLVVGEELAPARRHAVRVLHDQAVHLVDQARIGAELAAPGRAAVAHAASTSGPPSPVRGDRHQPGRRICAWLLMRLRPPALHRPYEAIGTNRAVGSAPGCSCGCALRPSIARTRRAPPSGPSEPRLATPVPGP